ncbi:MAG: dTDP-glucose 4,6-dehydratase [bacterium]
MDKKTLLITGGAGFIGSNFTRHILKKYPQYKIIVLDKLTYAGNLDNLLDCQKNKNFTFIKGDICNSRVVNKICKDGIDIIVNFAAETHVDRSIKSGKEFILTDILGTYILLEAVKKYKISRYIQISTDEVYGSIEKGSFKETDNLSPRSPYSASKAGADMQVLAFFHTFKLPVIITRSSNNFGPYQYPEKLIPLFITNLLQNKKIPLYGDGKNIRDWLYVIDNCQAIDLVMHKGEIGQIYNIGANDEKQNIEITFLILKLLKKGNDSIQYVADRLGHDRRYSVNCEKIKKLGWSPVHNFDIAIKNTVKWYVENKKWWEKIK